MVDPKPTGGKRILLIDDDETLREMYSVILAKGGYGVDTARDGVEGLAKAREGGYDLILLDLVMPNLDGVRVLQALKQEPAKKPNGPVVILSNAGYESVAKEVTSLGAKGFLMKAEMLPRDFIKQVQAFLQGSSTPSGP